MARGDRHGLALLGGDGPLAWVLRGPHYNSFALLQIAPSESHIAFELAGSRADLIPNLFDIYKDTQSQLLKSRFVLAAALRKPEIAALPSVKKHEPDAIGWLSSELHVGFPGKAEIMEVSFTATDPQEAATLVNGVIKAYQTEVVDAERRRAHHAHGPTGPNLFLEERGIAAQANELKQTADQLGTQDEATLSLKQQYIIQQIADYSRELRQSAV